MCVCVCVCVCGVCEVCEVGDTVAGELQAEEEVILQVTQEVGTAEKGLQNRGQCCPPLLSSVHL